MLALTSGQEVADAVETDVKELLEIVMDAEDVTNAQTTKDAEHAQELLDTTATEQPQELLLNKPSLN